MKKSVNHVNLVYKFLTKADEEAGIITGIGSKYGNSDNAGDVMMPGAFKKSIQDKLASNQVFPILWQHSWSNPIGIITDIKETPDGLMIKTQLNLDTQQGREAYSLAKMGALGGFSVGFFIAKYTVNDMGGFNITEGKLLEVSLVTFPCNEQAIIETVKSQFEGSVMNKPLTDAANKLRETIKMVQSVKVSKKEHSAVLQEILALVNNAMSDANGDGDDEMFGDSTLSMDNQVEEQAANKDVTDDTSTEDEPLVEMDDESVIEEKFWHSILNNLTKN